MQQMHVSMKLTSRLRKWGYRRIGTAANWDGERPIRQLAIAPSTEVGIFGVVGWDLKKTDHMAAVETSKEV